MLTMLLAFAAIQDARPTPPPPPPSPCNSEAHSAFDYWVGEWEVFGARDPETKVAESRIERLYDGCAVRENWMPLNGRGGGSLNSIRGDGRWHQRWVGSNGETVDFAGGPDTGGNIVLTGYWENYGGPGVARFVRMSYLKQEDGSVRQLGEISADHGKTFTTGFDLTYRPKS